MTLQCITNNGRNSKILLNSELLEFSRLPSLVQCYCLLKVLIRIVYCVYESFDF